VVCNNIRTSFDRLSNISIARTGDSPTILSENYEQGYALVYVCAVTKSSTLIPGRC